MSDATAQAAPARRVGRRAAVLIGLAIALAAVSIVRMTVGEPMPRVDDGSIDWATLGQYLGVRSNRVVMGLIVGAALSVAGAVLQSLLRNPLASPYILGVSTGSALGVMLVWSGFVAAGAIAVGHESTLATELGSRGGAMAGALATMAIVYLLAQRRGRVDPIGLLLIGVILNSINAAAIMFIGYLDPTSRADLMRWMMGYLDEGAGVVIVTLVGVLTAGGVAIAAWWGDAMDLATFPDAEARAMGVRLGRLRLGLFAVAGVLTAGSVMLAGPVGFVGLICPHMVRLLIGPANRWVVLGSALAGGVVVIGADAATKLLDTGARIGVMPLGVLTALIGGPVFIAMLRPQLGRGAA